MLSRFLLSVRGRISRRHFFVGYRCVASLQFLAIPVAAMVLTTKQDVGKALTGGDLNPIWLGVSVVTVPLALSLIVRRARDFNISAQVSLPLAILVMTTNLILESVFSAGEPWAIAINLISTGAILFLVCMPGSAGDNMFGPSPGTGWLPDVSKSAPADS